MIECGVWLIVSANSPAAACGSSSLCGIMPSRFNCPTFVMSRGLRTVVSISSRRNAMPSESARPSIAAPPIVRRSLGKLIDSGALTSS